MVTIQKDAGEILLFLYDSYINDHSVDAQKLLDTTKWDGKRIDKALKYLKNSGCIDIIHTLGNVDGVQHFILKSITPTGINIVENKNEFKKTFDIEVNLGLVKFSWEISNK